MIEFWLGFGCAAMVFTVAAGVGTHGFRHR